MAEREKGARKLHPRLRVVKNGDRVVNATRADSGSTVACAASAGDVASPPIYQQLLQQTAEPRWTQTVTKLAAPLAEPRPKLETRRQADDAYVNVFVELFQDRKRGTGGDDNAEKQRVKQVLEDACARIDPKIRGAVAERRNMLSATVPVTLLDQLREDAAVAFLHPAEPLKLDLPVAHRTQRGPSPRAITEYKELHRDGEGVLIGIIDVGGFDFAHPDFIDEHGDTRFVAIWDQGGNARPAPAKFGYGAELSGARLNAAVHGAKDARIPAVLLERQSQMDPSSHGTHVASIAAGKRGVCPKAQIAAVIIDVPDPADPVERRRSTFSDTSRITHAIEYLLDLAGDRPIAINISLGTNGGAHDGSSGVSRWLDAYLAAPGRAICVAAGNAGQEAPESESDLGWMMGRIHASGRVESRGLEVELEWTVVGDGIEDWSENELEIWYGPQDRFIVHVKPPRGEWIRVRPLEYVENHRLPSGTTLSVYNELYHPTNGSNYIAIYLSPNFDPESYRGVDGGIWRVRLEGDEVRDGRFDAWIERDDPVEIGRHAGRRMFRFPSFFSAKSNVDSHSLSSLACGHRVIAVANLDDARLRINASSSQGPTRDGRCKPEIAARGTDVVAANGFAEEPWVAMTGTSMACPYVTGVVGLMLATNPEITAAQCVGILQRTARPLPGGNYNWLNDVGFGRIHPEHAIREASMINSRTDLKP